MKITQRKKAERYPKSKRHVLSLIILLSLIIGITLGHTTYYIGYWPTDSWHLYIPAAKSLSQLNYLSEIHNHNRFASLHGKEALVLGIAIMQSLLHDTQSLFPNTLLLIVAFSMSIILTYILLQRWFNLPIALFGTFLFLTTLWPYITILQGAHQPLIYLNFLLAACFMTWPGTIQSQTIISRCSLRSTFILSGAFIGCMLFSSPTFPFYFPYLILLLWYQLKQSTERLSIIKTIFLLLSGFIISYCAFTFPHPVKNITGYLDFLNASKMTNNFTHPQFFFGYEFALISKRGAGITWIGQYMHRVMPTLFILYGISIIFLLFHTHKNLRALIIILVSLSTPIMMESLQIAQFGRNYFSWLPGIIFLICFAINKFQYSYWVHYSRKLQQLTVLILCTWSFCHLYFNIHTFLKDVLPSRMTTHNLHTWLAKHADHTISTYNQHPYAINTTNYINHPRQQDKVHFHFIDSINEATSGYIVIPPLTGKSIWANCQRPDYSEDTNLMALIRSGKMQDYIVAILPTMTSSRIWPQEEEYCSFLDLHLKQISDVDRMMGHVFILDADKLQRKWFNSPHI